jgi:serine phosphatase RsbU (regulator of sigma subunit)
MIYGILDTSTKTFSFARAGHNAILKLSQDGDHSFITPSGIGLGLTEGKKFEQNLQETSIELVQEELLIFYTDGITEAMNDRNEEYGEQRLLKTSILSKQKSVTDIKNEILGSVDEFLGSCQAHDDQTMIVVKCLE